MSNPAVICLAEVSGTKANQKSIRIEDNLGESIHIHIDDHRLDLTIEEFAILSDIVWKSLQCLDEVPCGIKESNFVSAIYKATKYEKPEFEINEVLIKNLKFILRKKFLRFYHIFRLVSVAETPQYLYLNGPSELLSEYPQKNYYTQTNKERMKYHINQALTIDFNSNENLPISFGKKSTVIRDGMHRCASVAYKYGVNTRYKILSVTNVTWREKLNIAALWSIYSISKNTLILFRRLIISLIR